MQINCNLYNNFTLIITILWGLYTIHVKIIFIFIQYIINLIMSKQPAFTERKIFLNYSEQENLY